MDCACQTIFDIPSRLSGHALLPMFLLFEALVTGLALKSQDTFNPCSVVCLTIKPLTRLSWA